MSVSQIVTLCLSVCVPSMCLSSVCVCVSVCLCCILLAGQHVLVCGLCLSISLSMCVFSLVLHKLCVCVLVILHLQCVSFLCVCMGVR